VQVYVPAVVRVIVFVIPTVVLELSFHVIELIVLAVVLAVRTYDVQEVGVLDTIVGPFFALVEYSTILLKLD
jgi:hypothetical protein